MADLPSDKVDEAKQVFEVFDKKYEVNFIRGVPLVNDRSIDRCAFF